MNIPIKLSSDGLGIDGHSGLGRLGVMMLPDDSRFNAHGEPYAALESLGK